MKKKDKEEIIELLEKSGSSLKHHILTEISNIMDTKFQEMREFMIAEMKLAVSAGISDAHTLTLDVEKHVDDKTGIPLSKPKKGQLTVNILSFLAEYLSKVEGAFRGNQEDGNKLRNIVSKQVGKFDSMREAHMKMGEIFMGMEFDVKNMGKFSRMILTASKTAKIMDILDEPELKNLSEEFEKDRPTLGEVNADESKTTPNLG